MYAEIGSRAFLSDVWVSRSAWGDWVVVQTSPPNFLDLSGRSDVGTRNADQRVKAACSCRPAEEDYALWSYMPSDVPAI